MSAAARSLPRPDPWLSSIARSVRSALADGALVVTDEAGFLTLVRPDGRHLTVAPHIVAALHEAGLMPPLPDAVEEPAADDPIDAAERDAIQAEPAMPPEGTPERARQDAKQAEMVRGLLASALVRPSCFPGEASRPPPAGAFCSCCKGRRWWFPKQPDDGGNRVSSHWRCRTCRPPARLSENQIVGIY
jgi:hypothetical protein